MIELSSGEVLGIVLGVIAFVISIIAFVRANPQATPAAVDTEVTRRLDEQRRDRENMDRLERAYQQNSVAQQQLFNTVIAALRFVAPLTPITSDDAALALLEDVTVPGAPDAAQG